MMQSGDRRDSVFAFYNYHLLCPTFTRILHCEARIIISSYKSYDNIARCIYIRQVFPAEMLRCTRFVHRVPKFHGQRVAYSASPRASARILATDGVDEVRFVANKKC